MHKEEEWFDGILVEAINKQNIVLFKRINLSFVLVCKQNSKEASEEVTSPCPKPGNATSPGSSMLPNTAP